jgi:hypothetical protein
MATLSIELPEGLFQQIRTRGISKPSLEKMVNRMVQAYLYNSFAVENNKASPTQFDDKIFAQFEPPVYRYSTVSLPASSLNGWLNLIPEGYEGDALADTEALYEEV